MENMSKKGGNTGYKNSRKYKCKIENVVEEHTPTDDGK